MKWKKDPPEPATSRPEIPSTTASSGDQPRQAMIESSISIQGNISGQGDLVIEGRIQGAIQLENHNVTVGRAARVEADIHGKRICIDGEVKGDLFGDEVVIRESGRVEGNATAARVTLENGCSFRGTIDMRSASTAPVAAAGDA